MHGDVKPSNVLVSFRDDAIACAKVCDFGMSRIKRSFEQTTTARGIQGTPCYMAPEQLRGKVKVKCNYKTDVWATGSTIVEIFVGRDLWATPVEDDPVEFVKNCLQKKVDPPSLGVALNTHPGLFNSLQPVFSVQPDSRPTMKDVHKLF